MQGILFSPVRCLHRVGEAEHMTVAMVMQEVKHE